MRHILAILGKQEVLVAQAYPMSQVHMQFNTGCIVYEGGCYKLRKKCVRPDGCTVYLVKKT